MKHAGKTILITMLFSSILVSTQIANAADSDEPIKATVVKSPITAKAVNSKQSTTNDSSSVKVVAVKAESTNSTNKSSTKNANKVTDVTIEGTTKVDKKEQADLPKSLTDKINSIQSELKELSDFAATTDSSKLSRSELNDYSDKVDKLKSEYDDVQTQVNESLDSTSSEIKTRTDMLKKAVRDEQMSNATGDDDIISIITNLFTNKKTSDEVTDSTAKGTVVSSQSDSIKEIESLNDKYSKQQSVLNEVQSDIEELKAVNDIFELQVENNEAIAANQAAKAAEARQQLEATKSSISQSNDESSIIYKAVTPSTNVASNSSGNAIVDEARKHIGKSYVWGAKGPDTFDCSGFTAYVYRQVTGKEIGGWTVPQESSGTEIPLSDAQPGDLYFWGSRGNTYHVAIAIGNGMYIHAPTEGQTVTEQSVSNFSPNFAIRVS